MNGTYLKNLFLSNPLLKLTSLFLGYSFWYIASAHQIVTLQCRVPLSFNELPQHYSINAPEDITITLQGKRIDMYELDHTSLAVHRTIKKISPGKHALCLTKQDLFLPESITLLQYSPSNLSVTIKEL